MGPEMQKSAETWRIPNLLLYAGDDRQVAAHGSRKFYENTPKNIVTAHEFSDFYHEILNDIDSSSVLRHITEWLNLRLQQRSPVK
jgi:alpha-beta hydrolase superfamily lysophospholipase